MTPQMIQPREQYMLRRHTVDPRAVLEHLRLVLTAFANKPGYSRFYIGITNDLDVRLRSHQDRKPEFRLMVPVYEDPASVVGQDGFDLLEVEAIKAFRAGIKHPDTQQVRLRCENGPGGAPPKRVLYILVG